MTIVRNGGFTLFELLVAISLVGLIVGLSVTGINNLLDRDMKQATNRLATTVRYLYNKAATDGTYIRLMFDFESQTYWVEATGDPYLISDPNEIKTTSLSEKKKAELEKAKQKKKTASTEEETQVAGELVEEEKLLPKEPVFAAASEKLLKPQRLPDTVYLKDVYVEHAARPIDHGKAIIAFFPNGYVEKAVINLRDEDDEVHFSVMTNPVNGRVSIEDVYRTLERQ
ncbi:MAG: prepilin-type N-terminal cleavage/methylation domain-containing protein [Deltaproteobacteria bacterium]|nr:prepilin-type N-terminal cleavage/methylation domain-containing protein [Deltaproteobacteria bacterium]